MHCGRTYGDLLNHFGHNSFIRCAIGLKLTSTRSHRKELSKDISYIKFYKRLLCQKCKIRETTILRPETHRAYQAQFSGTRRIGPVRQERPEWARTRIFFPFWSIFDSFFISTSSLSINTPFTCNFRHNLHMLT